MAVALTRHFENLRYLLTLYVKYNNDPTAPFDNIGTINYIKLNYLSSQQNNEINILNLPQAFEIGNIFHANDL